MSGNWDDYYIEDEDPPEVIDGQEEIPTPNIAAGELGSCSWCDAPAVYGGVDIGLPKPPNRPKPLVQACEHHMRHTIAPALAAREEERRLRRLARKST